MNFETLLFAAAFLLLAILTLPKTETSPDDSATNIENNEPTTNISALYEDGAATKKELGADSKNIDSDDTDSRAD